MVDTGLEDVGLMLYSCNRRVSSIGNVAVWMEMRTILWISSKNRPCI
jgi:hypothetical protein